MHFIDANIGFAAGDFGKIIKTTDGGETWTNIITPNSTIIGTIWFSDVNRGWAAQMDGNLIYTTDGGVNWESDTSFGITAMWTTFFTSPDTGFVAGNNGKMYITTNGSILNIGDKNQNLKADNQLNIFPNPVKEEAEIDYYLASKGLCLINLYDENGKKADCLISEIKEKGKHQLRFNSDKYESGVYFIELLAGSKKIIKKLIISH